MLAVEKERKKAEKAAKLEAKKAKAAQAQPASTKEKKVKEKKVEEVLPDYVEDTPEGDKKRIRSFEDPHFKAYNPIAVESAWYSWWEKQGYFQPEFKEDGSIKDEGSFVIVHPPPNVTGNLHMGHALGDSLQDLLIRWNRMHGKTTLWLPGCDHAGISTQSVVENMLWRRQQKTRHDLGRTKFVETVLDWKDEYHKRINNVLKRLGGSFDWTREGNNPRCEIGITNANVSKPSRWTQTSRLLWLRRLLNCMKKASSTVPTDLSTGARS